MKPKKGNTLPDYQNPPPPPEPLIKKLTVEETTAQVLTAIRQHESEEQNTIFEAVAKELVIDRHNRYMASRDEENRAGKNMEIFLASTRGIEDFVKAHNEKPRS